MAEFAVKGVGLAKRYRLQRIESLYSQIARRLRGQERQWMWALDHLDFEIPQGIATGIIGRNGAGKSTLLKILSRITEPTEGYVDVRGRVGSLLEVGTGFHPELTGRENIYFNGAILGMRRPEVQRKFDDIVDFSGVSDHIDKPVKWYSSGMYVRLGFAVAAFLEPEILVVDEVLAVGDAEFQKRCIGRMGEVAHEGRTVLFVSHNMQAVRMLCEQAIMLESGRIVMHDDVQTVARYYLASVDSSENGRRRWPDPSSQPGDDLCRVVEVRVVDDNGEAAGSFFNSRPINIEIEFDLASEEPSFSIAFDLLTADGVQVLGPHHRDAPDDEVPEFHAGRNCFRCTIPPGLLNAGRYVVSLRISLHRIRWVAYEDGVLSFDVIADYGESLFVNSFPRAGVISPTTVEWSAVEPHADEELAPPVPASGAG